MNKLRNVLCLILAMLLALGTVTAGADYSGIDLTQYLYQYSGELSEGQINIVKRARQLIEIEWTPLYDVTQWGYAGTYYAGQTYRGVPYGQPVQACYIGFDATLSEFVEATEDSESLFYTEYSRYNKIAPYYSIDCSGFVSYAWGLGQRRHTRTLPEEGYLVDEQSIDGLEVGDCLNNISSHAVLVGGVVRDESGQVIYVEILEQTPVIAQRTVFGAGGDHSLEYFNSYYFGGGYRIYRNPQRDLVEYDHDCSVPIDGDYCDKCSGGAPCAVTESYAGCRVVSLESGGGMDIYYTTDGSDPIEYGELYTEPLEFYETAHIRAVATDGFSFTRQLSYMVTIAQAAAPVLKVKTGMSDGRTVSVGSTVTLTSSTYGAAVYYTTDGSQPDEYSELYTAPITVTEDVEIKAIAVAQGYQNSITSSFTLEARNFSSFSDVDADAWYNAAVNYVYSMGLFNGTGAGSFSPEQGMTRGMFVTALGRLAGVPSGLSGTIGIVTGDDVNIRSGASTDFQKVGTANRMQVVEIYGESDGWYSVGTDGITGYIRGDYVSVYDGFFTDLDTNAYYAPYVQWVYLTGVSSGTGSGSFSSDEPVTRRDMAVLLYNYAQTRGLSLQENGDGSIFSDDWSISAASRDAVYALRRAGVINGMGDGSFCPDGGATRAQVAQIFMNFIYALC